MPKLSDIHSNYDTDKGTDHTYISHYDELLAPFQDATVHFLEVGVLSGGSLRMFREYFTNATIYGMDNFSQTSGFKGVVVDSNAVIASLTAIDKMRILKCDSRDKAGVDATIATANNPRFNIIIDDGDHSVQSQLATFANLRPYWTGDLYVIEDIDVAGANLLVSSLRTTYPDTDVELRVLNVVSRKDDVLVVIKKRS